MANKIPPQRSLSHTIKCLVCGTAGGGYSSDVGTYQIFKCADCGLEYTHPNPTDNELQAFYEDYSDIRARHDVVQKNAKKNIGLLKEFGFNHHSKVLDYGTGNGDFVTIAGENCFGIDLKTTDTDRVFRKIELLPNIKFDFICLWGVLEHLNNPVKVIGELSTLINPGGKIVITTIDAEGIIPYYYKPIEHLTYWTKKSFEILFQANNLQKIHSRPYMMYQAKDIYVDRLLSRTPDIYKKAFESAVANLPDYVEVPTNEIFIIAQKIKDESTP